MEDLLGPLRLARHRTPGRDTPAQELQELASCYVNMLDSAGETEAHQFLQANPVLLVNGIMGPAANLERVALFSKLRFGDEFVTDFAFVTADSDGARWTFIELEDPCDAIFKKNGDPTAALVHGERQINDWSAFLKHDLAFAKRRLADIHRMAPIRGPREMWRAPTFMVIIGREGSLDGKTRLRKAEMNDRDPRRQIATYDRLNPRRWLDEPGVLDASRERGHDGTPWPNDDDTPWNMTSKYLDAMAEAKRADKPATVD